MAQENLKLLSVRVDPETLGMIDHWLRLHPYWKRNTVINGILSAVLDAFSNGDIYDMVRYNRHFYEKPSGTFQLPPTLNQKSADEKLPL